MTVFLNIVNEVLNEINFSFCSNIVSMFCFKKNSMTSKEKVTFDINLNPILGYILIQSRALS